MLADGEEAEAGGQHEALLRAADRAIDAPLLLPEVDRADRGDAVDEQQGRMLARVKRLAHAATSLVTPVAVSLCVQNTALIRCSLSAASFSA